MNQKIDEIANDVCRAAYFHFISRRGDKEDVRFEKYLKDVLRNLIGQKTSNKVLK